MIVTRKAIGCWETKVRTFVLHVMRNGWNASHNSTAAASIARALGWASVRGCHLEERRFLSTATSGSDAMPAANSESTAIHTPRIV